MSQLEIKGLCKSFGAVKAVDHVTLTVDTGEMLCLLGPSGCGKTTLLRILSGFLEPDEGAVVMGGVDVTKLTPERRPTSLVFQNYALFPHLNVYENAAFGLKLKKMPSNQIKEKVMHTLKLVGLEGMEKRAITQLSGGQQQRVALARALVMEPKVLLLDEPLSNLDAKLRVETRQQIRRLQQSLGITAVFVTHDQEEAMSMGDKIAILESGRLQQLGSPMELYRHPVNKFVAGFLGTPAMNFLEVQSTAGIITAAGVTLPGLPAGSGDGTYTLGIRPEDITLGENGQMAPLQATIDQVELLGDHALIYLEWEGKTICCRTAIPEHLEEGSKTAFTLDLSRAKLFDQGTGVVIS